MLANLLKCDIILVVTDITLVSISAGIAQSVEHFTLNEGVVGSSPISSFSKNSVKKGLPSIWDSPFSCHRYFYIRLTFSFYDF